MVCSIFAHPGGQYYGHGLKGLLHPWIIQDSRPKIVDALLMLISRMGQRAFHSRFCLLNRQYIHFGRMKLYSHLFAGNVRLTIVDARLTHKLLTYSQSVDAQQLSSKIHTVVIGSRLIISIYKHLNPTASKPLNFCSTT